MLVTIPLNVMSIIPNDGRFPSRGTDTLPGFITYRPLSYSKNLE